MGATPSISSAPHPLPLARLSRQIHPPAFKGICSTSNFGIVDWGSLSIDEGRRLMLVNSSSPAVSIRTSPRAEADRDAARLKQLDMPQTGTPFAALLQQFLAARPAPPRAAPGKLTAIDLATRKILAEPLGNEPRPNPLGIAVPAGSIRRVGRERRGVLFTPRRSTAIPRSTGARAASWARGGEGGGRRR